MEYDKRWYETHERLKRRRSIGDSETWVKDTNELKEWYRKRANGLCASEG